jgi:hypothetical protein
VAAILASEPQPISAAQPMSPPALDRVVKTCLEKDPDERFQTAHDLKLQLRWIAERGSQVQPAPRTPKSARLWWVAIGVCLLIAIAAVATYLPVPDRTRSWCAL